MSLCNLPPLNYTILNSVKKKDRYNIITRVIAVIRTSKTRGTDFVQVIRVNDDSKEDGMVVSVFRKSTQEFSSIKIGSVLEIRHMEIDCLGGNLRGSVYNDNPIFVYSSQDSLKHLKRNLKSKYILSLFETWEEENSTSFQSDLITQFTEIKDIRNGSFYKLQCELIGQQSFENSKKLILTDYTKNDLLKLENHIIENIEITDKIFIKCWLWDQNKQKEFSNGQILDITGLKPRQDENGFLEVTLHSNNYTYIEIIDENDTTSDKLRKKKFEYLSANSKAAFLESDDLFITDSQEIQITPIEDILKYVKN